MRLLQVGLPVALVRHKALFWVNNGVLVESRAAADGGGAAAASGSAVKIVPEQPLRGVQPSAGSRGSGRVASGGGAQGRRVGDAIVYCRAQQLDPSLQGV